jgi:hypothetical protein
MIDGVRKKTGTKPVPPAIDARPLFERRPVSRTPKKEERSFHSLDERPSRGAKFFGWACVVLVIVAAFFVVGWKTRSATVTLVSPLESFAISKTIGIRDKPTPGFLRVESVSIPFEYRPGEESFAAAEQSSEEPVPVAVEESWYATGTVRIFNTTSSPINLRTQTRFQNPDGQLFYSQKAVTVPSGTKEKPGTVESPIRSAGKLAELKTTLDDFILPGLPEAKQKLIFGRSVVALTKDTDQADHDQAILSTTGSKSAPLDSGAIRITQSDAFKAWISGDFATRAKERFPAGYEILSGSEQYTNIEALGETGTKGVVTFALVEKDEFSGILADEISRARGIGKDSIVVDERSHVRGVGSQQNTLTLSGSVSYHVETSKENIEALLLGSRVSTFSSMMKDFPWLKRATLSVRPWWTPKLPANKDHLTIIFDKE